LHEARDELQLLQNYLKHNNAQTNIVTPEPSGTTISSTPTASISPITNIIKEGNDCNVLDLAS